MTYRPHLRLLLIALVTFTTAACVSQPELSAQQESIADLAAQLEMITKSLPRDVAIDFLMKLKPADNSYTQCRFLPDGVQQVRGSEPISEIKPYRSLYFATTEKVESVRKGIDSSGKPFALFDMTLTLDNQIQWCVAYRSMFYEGFSEEKSLSFFLKTATAFHVAGITLRIGKQVVPGRPY